MKWTIIILMLTALAACNSENFPEVEEDTGVEEPDQGEEEEEEEEPSALLQETQELYEQARGLWESQNISDYIMVTYTHGNSVCLPEEEQDSAFTIEIEVYDNEVESVIWYEGGNSELDPERYGYTIDDVFDDIAYYLSQNPVHISDMDTNEAEEVLPSFDESLGFPVSFYFRYPADTELGCETAFLNIQLL